VLTGAGRARGFRAVVELEIRDAVEGETLTLSLEGELDLESVPHLDAQISGGKR
jgi:hypothetical protein